MPTSSLQSPTSEQDGARDEHALRCELAALYRLLDHFDMTELTFTHASVRLPGPGRDFLLNPYGLMFDEIKASNLVRLGLDGTVRSDTEFGINPTALVVHGAIHTARDDAKSILHCHTTAGCAVAAQEGGLLPVNQISMEFYNRIGYHDYHGISFNTAERDSLIADLGTNDALVLRNHGLLTVGATPAEAFIRMFYLDKACQIQVAAQAGGSLRLPSADMADYVARQFAGAAASDEFSDDNAFDRAWTALVRMLDRTAPDYKD